MNPIQTIKDTLRSARDRALTESMLSRLRSHQRLHDRSAILIATPKHGNLGDQAIVLAQREFLTDNFPELAVFEVQRFQYEIACERIAELVRPCDLIVIDGGGNVGTLWPEENEKMNDIVRRFSGNPVVIFPQTAYFDNTDEGRECERRTAMAYAANPRLIFFSRDKATYEKVASISPTTANLFVPDIVLYHNATSTSARSGALLCLRDDKERTVSDGAPASLRGVLELRGLTVSETSTVVSVPKSIDEDNRVHTLSDKWAEFCSSEVVVTDRLHGMIFSAITGTPCVALDNVSRKVSQGNAWIRHIANIRVAASPEEVPTLLDEVLAAGPCVYDRTPLSSYHREMREAIERALL